MREPGLLKLYGKPVRRVAKKLTGPPSMLEGAWTIAKFRFDNLGDELAARDVWMLWLVKELIEAMTTPPRPRYIEHLPLAVRERCVRSANAMAGAWRAEQAAAVS